MTSVLIYGDGDPVQTGTSIIEHLGENKVRLFFQSTESYSTSDNLVPEVWIKSSNLIHLLRAVQQHRDPLLIIHSGDTINEIKISHPIYCVRIPEEQNLEIFGISGTIFPIDAIRAFINMCELNGIYEPDEINLYKYSVGLTGKKTYKLDINSGGDMLPFHDNISKNLDKLLQHYKKHPKDLIYEEN